MEYASFLAGERWSDHPACTHPLLAGVARAVNDHMSDEERSGLVEMIPSVIGLNSDDPVVDVGIAIRCAAVALPVVAEGRQRALATGLLSAQYVLDPIEASDPMAVHASELIRRAEVALSRAPHSDKWAKRFFEGSHLTLEVFSRRPAPAIVRVAVLGIAGACIPDPGRMLHDLLASVIEDCTRWLESANPGLVASLSDAGNPGFAR